MDSTEKHFDKLFARCSDPAYALAPGRMGAKDRKIMRLLEARGVAGARCLDIGPGTGRWLTYLQGLGALELTAVDISNEALRLCRRVAHRTVKIDIEKEKLPFPVDYFDIVTAFEVIEHLINPDVFLSEIARVARADALVILSTPNICSMISRVRLLFGALPVAAAADPTHVRFYRQTDLVRCLAPFGLRPEFMPTAISLHPGNPKSRLHLPSSRILCRFDDSLLFTLKPIQP